MYSRTISNLASTTGFIELLPLSSKQPVKDNDGAVSD